MIDKIKRICIDDNEYGESFTAYNSPEELETFTAPLLECKYFSFGSNVKRVAVRYLTECTFLSQPEVICSELDLCDYVTEFDTFASINGVVRVIEYQRFSLANVKRIRVSGCPIIQTITNIGDAEIIYKCRDRIVRKNGKLPIWSGCKKVIPNITINCMKGYTSFSGFDGVHEMSITIRGPNDTSLLKTLPYTVKKLTLSTNIKHDNIWTIILSAIPSTITHITIKDKLSEDIIMHCPPTVEVLVLRDLHITSKSLLKFIFTNYDKLKLRELNVDLISIQRRYMKILNENYSKISINRINRGEYRWTWKNVRTQDPD